MSGQNRSRAGLWAFVAMVALLGLLVGPRVSAGRAGMQATPVGGTPAASLPGGTPQAELQGTPEGATPVGGTPVAGGEGGVAPVDLDVLFIGAHPDDEAFGLSTYGQWNEEAGVEAGVITITRGEGGGNAVGEEEGPALGLLREAEERRAVGRAGIEHIYNLDLVDFYYTVSAPLTEEVWGVEETLEKVVRVVRATRPDVIVTMNPAPSPGNHGHHQVAARLAVEAFAVAADPSVFPEQIADEGLPAWRAAKIFRGGFAGEAPTGPACASAFVPAEPTDVVQGVWSGRTSARNGGATWAEVEREAQREYASQGWAVFPDVATDPVELPCDFFTLVDSRVPFSLGNSSPTAMLEGALTPAAGGLPLGTEFYLSTDRFDVAPGQSIEVTAHARSGGAELADATVALTAPEDWEVEGEGVLGTVGADGEATTTFTVTVAADAAVETRGRLVGTLAAGGLQGATAEAVRVVPPVRGTIEPLPQVAQFREWAASTGAPQLDGLIDPLLSLGAGETRDVRVDLVNRGDAPADGVVDLALPAGFSADAPSQPFSGLAPGDTGSVTFRITNTDPALPTANEGGDYPLTVVTRGGDAVGSQRAALNLVPTTAVPQAATAPTVDGQEGAGEYAGPQLDLSRLWEGDDPESPADASGTAKATWVGNDLYLLVNVVDDTLGTVLPERDARRHWRTDSVEIAIDPRGTSENTATTFKIGAFPTMAEGNPAAARDADNNQGPVAQTAPGLEVASTVSEPYAGYTLEVKIPLEALPAAVDPARMTLNVFIYDSDTQDKTGQTRLGWSTFDGVQGDPYRWGRATMDGYAPPADRPTEPAEPSLPLDPTRSVTSPQSILQAATDGVALAGDPAAPADTGVALLAPPTVTGDRVSFDLRAAGDGTARVFLWNGTAVVGERTLDLAAGETVTLDLPLVAGEDLAGPTYLLVGFEAGAGGTTSLAMPLSD
ncbi:MAG: PIG-L family deacetylase [Chloroflexota bacterium]|nr:PIG-L family deacetylase [Chloroflexota bacterium]